MTTDSVDIVSSLAMPLPITVIAEILGVDSTDLPDFKRWSDDMALSFDPTLSTDEAERVAASDVEFRDYVARAIRARRANPHDDLISGLVAAQDEDGSQLSDAEAISAVALLLFAGNATTTDLIANGLLALLQNPDQLTALQSDPSLIAKKRSKKCCATTRPSQSAIGPRRPISTSTDAQSNRVSGSGSDSAPPTVTPLSIPNLTALTSRETRFIRSRSVEANTCASVHPSPG